MDPYFSQTKYLTDLLAKVNMLNANGMPTPVISSSKLSKMGSTAVADPTQFRTKHMELDIFFVREKVLSKSLVVAHVPAQDQWADALTKPLSAVKFIPLRTKLRVFNKNDLTRPPLASKGG
ncbi:hypothetical protein KIW84_024410 [Lathyrus oleraceus]|uniref:Uncharacterized protein n=1 Tax=Pisum sativum TaxID=3888 RepID=A0A9D5B7P0_PEA|nr:hypothetical protein KIW84_024410 [Pisum sativum]